MSGNLSQFATAIDQAVTNDYSPLPAGEYTAIVTDADPKETAKGGQRIAVTYNVLDDTYKDRKVWDNINTVNTNAKAVEIGIQRLKQMKDAVGLAEVKDTSQLLNKPVAIVVGIDRNDNTRNVVRSVKPLAKTAAFVAPVTAGYVDNDSPFN
jgi:hypothetical protein